MDPKIQNMDSIRQRVKDILEEISQNHNFEIDALEIAEDHVYVSMCFSPRYSVFEVGGILKNISASVISHKHPDVKKEIWEGEFWEDSRFFGQLATK